MTFSNKIREFLSEHSGGLTPQQLRDLVKINAPEYYDTESNRRNVERGHYKDLDHALLAKIYLMSNSAGDIFADKSQKPLKLFLMSATEETEEYSEEILATENLDKLEIGVGTLYVLGTNLYTKSGEEIIKIGITTGSVENRINQLYTTSSPYKFRVITQHETRNYGELEQSMHKIFDPFRINRSREYFTDKCLPYIDRLINIHNDILSKA